MWRRLDITCDLTRARLESALYRSKSAVPNKLFALNTSHRVVHNHLVYNVKRGRCGAVLFTKILLLLRGRKCSRVLGPHSVKVGSTLIPRFGHATDYVLALSAPGQPFSAASEVDGLVSKVLSKQRLFATHLPIVALVFLSSSFYARGIF